MYLEDTSGEPASSSSSSAASSSSTSSRESPVGHPLDNSQGSAWSGLAQPVEVTTKRKKPKKTVRWAENIESSEKPHRVYKKEEAVLSPGAGTDSMTDSASEAASEHNGTSSNSDSSTSTSTTSSTSASEVSTNVGTKDASYSSAPADPKGDAALSLVADYGSDDDE